MSLVVFEHCSIEDSGRLGTTLQGQGHRLRVVRLYDGDPVPTDLDDVDGVISMGGPMNVDQSEQYPWLAEEGDYLKSAHEAQVPVVGVCLGAQLIASALGGKVDSMQAPEVGWGRLKLGFPGTVDPIYAGIGWETTQFHMHGQEVTELPPGATPLAGSSQCKIQAFKVGLRTYGFQYHFEWDMQDLAVVAKDGLVSQTGQTADGLLAEAREYYARYRRLGDRLCETLATTLFPIDKRR